MTKKYTRKTSSLTIVVSLSLVLFLLGAMGLLLLTGHKLSNYVKENLAISVTLKEETKEVEMRKLQKLLDASPYVKSSEYITKDVAVKEMQEQLGVDVVNILGKNPLFSSINLKLHAEYANEETIVEFQKEILTYNSVEEVYYKKDLLKLINKNIRNISITILIISLLLLLISFTLINNTIRLSIYAQRFIINTMQIVGATDRFIRKPFMGAAVGYGVISALIASILLVVGVIFLPDDLKLFFSLKELLLWLVLGLLFVVGILFACLATYTSVNRYLRKKTGDLY